MAHSKNLLSVISRRLIVAGFNSVILCITSRYRVKVGVDTSFNTKNSILFLVFRCLEPTSELVQLKLNIESSVGESTPTEAEYGGPLPLVEVGVSRLDQGYLFPLFVRRKGRGQTTLYVTMTRVKCNLSIHYNRIIYMLYYTKKHPWYA